jgi:Tfp pilus assembly protein PilO
MGENGIKATSKGVIVLLVMAIVFLLGITGGAVAFWDKVSAATLKMEAKKKQVEEAQKMALSLQESKLEYSDVKSQLQNLEQSISTEAYIPTLLKQLESLSQSVDMRVLSVRPVKMVEPPAKNAKSAKNADASASTGTDTKKEKPSQPFYKEQKIDVEVGGYYLNALDLIYRITSFPKIIAVNSVQMSPSVTIEQLGSPLLKVQLSITAFILNESPDKSIEMPGTTADVAPTSKGAGNETR